MRCRLFRSPLLRALALTLVCSPWVAATGDDAEKYYAAAVKAEAARDFKAASVAYEKVLDIDPEYRDALGRWEACQEPAEWQAGLTGTPGAGDLVRLGEIHCRQGQIEAERRAYADAIRLDDGCCEAHGHLAMSNYLSPGGSMVTVVREIRRFLETSPHRERLQGVLADWNVYGRLRIFDDELHEQLTAAAEATKAGDPAKAAMRLAAAATGDVPDVFRAALHARVGALRALAGDPEGARQAFLEALKHPSGGTAIQARLGLARLALAAGDTAAALDHLRAAVAEGSRACRMIAAERDRAFKALFASENAEIRTAAEKLADTEEGDAPIRAEIRDAVERAAREGKRVLIEWYGPYCPYVMSLEERLAHPRIHKILEERFVFVRMNQGSMHRGLSLDEEYGSVMSRYGVPCFILLKADGSIDTVQRDAELMSLPNRAFDVEKIAKWLLEAAH
jgi:tetratricopeptide (TPR) repeat protein